MKVLHVLVSDTFSGAENVACQIINMTKEFAQSIYISRNGAIKNALESRKIEYIMLDKLNVVKIKKILKVEKPDIIHAHDMKASFICSLAMDKNIKFISHIHNNDINARRLTMKSILYAYAAGKTNHIIWVSKSSYESYLFSGLFKQKSTILYNVIDTSRIVEKVESDTKEYFNDIVFVGRLSYPKNPQMFVKIIAKIKEQFPNIKASMVGTGEYYNEIFSLIKEYQLEKNIDLLGFVDNPYKLIKSSKIMMITSEWEGMPMCALEAMSLGLPIISTPVDGMKDLIKENVNGFFARDIISFVKYANQLLNNEELCTKMSKNAKAFFETVNSYQEYKNKIKYLYMEA